jgi:hypothetical protein
MGEMDDDEKVLFAGPSLEHQEVVVQALREEGPYAGRLFRHRYLVH